MRRPTPPLPVRDAALPLDQLPMHRLARVCEVDAGADGGHAERARQLADIGFIPGEYVTVLARAWPGDDPMVVRVGHSSFALRRAEAACIRVVAGEAA